MKLIFQNVSKSYGKNKALQGFSATLTPGIYALMGPNGSGKSTLVNILTGNLSSDSGDIYYSENEDNPENILNMGVRFREKLGFMPQYPGYYPNFSVERFLYYIAAIKDIDKKEADKQIADILKRVELEDVRKRPIRTLSGGMKQRLGLSQAVLGSPKILILDEPTAGLDPKQRIEIRNYISEIALDKIVLLATHVVSDVEFTAKEIIMLRKGQIIAFDSAAALVKTTEGKVWNITCGHDEVARLQKKYHVTNINAEDDGVKLRVLHDGKPTETAAEVMPTLEDYYLSIFGTDEVSDKII